jgi:hypothetical protein
VVPELPAVGVVVEAMLARAPTDRPRDAGVVLEALQEIEATLPREERRGGRAARVRRGPRTRWLAAGALLGVLASAAVAVPAALWLRGAARSAGAPLVLAAASTLVPCSWKVLARADFDAPVPGARWRNGEFGRQEMVTREERGAWLEASDWNQLFIPAGARRPDVFAVEASFLAASAAGRGVGVGLHAYGDPAGPMDQRSSDLRHGRGIVLVEAPHGAARYEWGVVAGMNTTQVVAKGTLPGAISGRWHTLRVEGSRSRCWTRVLLDGAPLMFEIGSCDFEGGDVVLSGSASGAYVAADVLWREFRLFEGEPSCQ